MMIIPLISGFVFGMIAYIVINIYLEKKGR